MVKRVVAFFGFFVSALYGGALQMEGYGEILGFSHSQSRSDMTVRFVPAMSYALTDTITFHGQLGFEHPAEAGKHWYEGELEVFSFDIALRPDVIANVGKVHMPVGLYNLYHEPVYFLTMEPSRVEYLIIPAEWHENVVLFNHTQGLTTYTMGAISPMKSEKIESQTWIREGKEGHVRDPWHPGWIARIDHGNIEKSLIGGTVVQTPLVGSGGEAWLVEGHVKHFWDNGWEGTFLASKGWLHNAQGIEKIGEPLRSHAEGLSGTLGYDVGSLMALPHRQVVGYLHKEYAYPSTKAELGGSASAVGINYFFTPRVVFKGEYKTSSRELSHIAMGIGFVY